MKVLVRLLFVAMLGMLGVTTIGTSQAQAVPCGAPCAPPTYTYEVVSLTSYSNSTLYALGRVGSCSNAGTKCTLIITDSVSTSVDTEFGLSYGAVSAKIGASRTSSGSVGSTAKPARKLAANEQFRAYSIGVMRQYRLQKVQHSYYGGAQVVDTSGWLYSYQPYPGSIAYGIYAS